MPPLLRVSSDSGGPAGGQWGPDQSAPQWRSPPGLPDQRRHHRSAPGRPVPEQHLAHGKSTGALWELSAAPHLHTAGLGGAFTSRFNGAMALKQAEVASRYSRCQKNPYLQ